MVLPKPGSYKPNPDREVVQCRYSIEGPKVARHVVAWRRPCKNRTRDETGLCHVHLNYGWYVGKRKDEQ